MGQPRISDNPCHCDWPLSPIILRADHMTTMTSDQVEQIRLSIREAERDVDLAERNLKDRQLRLNTLKSQLQEVLISGVSALKLVDQNNNVKEPSYKPPENEDEASRKARVRRRWRVLGMKIKFGLVTQAMAVKRRNIQDASSFIDKESEV